MPPSMATDPLTWQSLLTKWTAIPVSDCLIVAAAVLYLWAASRATRWPAHRGVIFLAGLLVCVIALDSGISAYSHLLFSMHMAQHLLLIMVAPALLVLGQPWELVRLTSRGRLRSCLAAVAGSRPVALLTRPAAALVLYTVVLVGTHLTPFTEIMLTHPWVHHLEEALYLLSGYLLLLPMLGHEPTRWRLSYLLRLIMLFIAMVVDTVVGVVLMMTPYEPFPAYVAQHRSWGPSPLTDLHWGGAEMWVGGDGLMMLLAIVVISQWVSDPARQNDLGPWLDSARRSALADLTHHHTDTGQTLHNSNDIDTDDAALNAYNAMLSELAQRRNSDPS